MLWLSPLPWRLRFFILFYRPTCVPKYQKKIKKISIFNTCSACLDGPRVPQPDVTERRARSRPQQHRPNSPPASSLARNTGISAVCTPGTFPGKKYNYWYGETRKTNVGEFKEMGFDSPASPLRLKIGSKIRQKSCRTEDVNPDFIVQQGIIYKSNLYHRLRYRLQICITD